MADAQRDLELASALAVPPLDDLTRARLVRTAIAEHPDAGRPDAARPGATRPGGRLGAALGVAAALVIGAVIGTLVVTRPDDPESTTAARAPVSSPAPSSPASSSPAPGSPADAAAPAFEPAAATLLGDLGAVASASALGDAITARLEAAGERPAAPGGAGTADACVARGPAAAGLVVISAIGTATLGTAPVVVLVGPTPRGENLAVALDPASCAVLETVTLQG